MKIVQNTGSDRVIDLLRSKLKAGCEIDVVTATLSLFAFYDVRQEIESLSQCRLLLPSATTALSLFGSDADRSARNRLQNRWIASRLLYWLKNKSTLRFAPGTVPQGAIIVRDGNAEPTQALLGSL
ncbi:MAG: helicase, partial [Chlorobiaceae bacterium]|nr:helicase [Chlorobiaceae bacterium]